MAREHARVKLSIWSDEDFRALSPTAQHLYFVLMAHPKLDYAGVADWRPARISGFAAAWTAQDVEIAAQELSEARYIVIDLDTEEVLLRSFIRSDEFMDQPNMAVAMSKAYRAVASAKLRGVVIHELIRLHRDKPDLKGWAKVSDLLRNPSVDPSTLTPVHPSTNPSDRPSGKGHTNPSRNPSDHPSPTTAPNSLLLTPNSQLQKGEGQDLGEERNETLPASDATQPPPDQPPTTRLDTPADARCTNHRGVRDPGPCAGCRAARELAERRADRAADQAGRATEAAARACTRCDGVWIVDPKTALPTRRKCDHRRTA